VLDLDDLLAGEEGSIAAGGRAGQLEQPTDVGNPRPTRSFRCRPRRPDGPGVAFAAMAVSAAPPPRPGGGPPPTRCTPVAKTGSAVAEPPVPVRELALAWFEARAAYRPSSASEAVRPIELVLRHRKDIRLAHTRSSSSANR